MRSVRYPASLIICGFMVFLFVVHGWAHDQRRAMETADGYLKRGMYLEAIGAYRNVADNAVDRDMKARAALRIGDIYGYFLDNYDAALQFYFFVTKNYSSSSHAANAYFNAGMILYEKSRHSEALAQFREYLARFPDGSRRQTAEFMIQACMKPPPPGEQKKEAAPAVGADEMIRVLIMEGVKTVRIGGTAPCVIADRQTGAALGRLHTGQPVSVSMYDRFLAVNAASLSRSFIVIRPESAGFVTVNEKPYRGTVTIKRNNNGIDVINRVRLEEYLYGVVPKEMSPTWPIEALKAQAVAARTFVLYHKEKNRDREYDVYASTSSQVYGGVVAEDEKATAAVNETRSRILVHDGRLVLAYFHANSGGVTENAENVWTARVPYLKSVRDNFSTGVPGTRWSLGVDFAGVARSLIGQGIKVGTIHEIKPAEVSPTGRVMKIAINHSGG
ncbi:MAG: SpoIID/LytB domain-containing protein, partial [Deltaproteobacteria bacterium]|nr:SpoIID/LytB domain-containing protein [Deltaproteobacteria bacterium]